MQKSPDPGKFYMINGDKLVKFSFNGKIFNDVDEISVTVDDGFKLFQVMDKRKLIVCYCAP